MLAIVSAGTLEYSTYVGGSLNDQGWNIEVDSSGNAHITGYTKSSNYPTTPNAYDLTPKGSDEVIVTEINKDGSGLGYSTFISSSGSDTGILSRYY